MAPSSFRSDWLRRVSLSRPASRLNADPSLRAGWPNATDGLRRAVQLASTGFDRIAPARSGLSFLIYHRVGARTDSGVDLDTDQFRAQMEALATGGHVISIGEAVERLGRSDRGGSTAATQQDQSRAVVITFDDGTADWSDIVLPILCEYSLPAVFYAATAFVEDQRPFPGDAHPISWAGLRALVDSGLATIGSHTHTHPMFDRLEPKAAAEELDRSIGLLQDRLGVAVDHFAYPRAVRGRPAVEAEVRARFSSAVLAGGRSNQWNSCDRYRLSRAPVHRRDSPDVVASKASGGLRLEGTLREMLDRVRYGLDRRPATMR